MPPIFPFQHNYPRMYAIQRISTISGARKLVSLAAYPHSKNPGSPSVDSPNNWLPHTLAHNKRTQTLEELLLSVSPTNTHCTAAPGETDRVLLPLPVFGGNPRSGNLSSRFLRMPAITTHTLSGWLAGTCQSETGTRCLLTPTLSLQVHYTLFAFRQSDRILPQRAHNYSTFTRTKTIDRPLTGCWTSRSSASS